jgi:ankyrin repeat protein
MTPVYLSAGNGHKKIVEILLKAGADINNETIPASFSGASRHKDTHEKLLKNVALVNGEHNRFGFSIQFGAASGNKNIVTFLLKKIANAKNSCNYTPLHLSAIMGYKEIVKVIIKAGADVNAENINKQTPLHVSACIGHTEIVKVLLKYGANVDAENWFLQTPLHLSADYEHDDVTKLLLQAGASVGKTDKDNYRVLDYMDDKQKNRLGYKPESKSFSFLNWISSEAKSGKSVQNSEPTAEVPTETEHIETMGATFSTSTSHTITDDNNSTNKGNYYYF